MKKAVKHRTAILLHLELIVMSLIVLVPIVWILMSSLNEGTGLASSTLIPRKMTIENYIRLFTDTFYPVWLWNTFKVAALNTLVSVTANLLTAWIFSRFNFKGKKVGLMGLLLLSMFPTFLSMTALFTLFYTLGLYGNPMGLVIIYSAGSIPYNTWLIKGYMDGISVSLDEAAYIDGSSHFHTFFKIILPLSTPIITYCAVSQFMFPWMDYILPNLLLSGDKNRTLAVGLFSMISGKENSNFTMFAAGAVLVAVPIAAVFMLFQKYLVQGISAGADKG